MQAPDTSVLYEDNTIPLERVDLLEIEPETTYITGDGTRIRVTEDMDFEIIKFTPLREGERVSGLSNTNNYAALKLFFKILNKE